MKPDPEARHAPGARDGVRRGGAPDHQARGGEDALLVGLLDGLVDRLRQPEIVGGDDEPLQGATSRRSRRKRKNSTPSFSRRFIISGLSAISPTIEAIFGMRK